MEIKQQTFDAETSLPEVRTQPVVEPQVLDMEQLQWVSGAKTEGPVGGW